jgi:hypothetical protein
LRKEMLKPLQKRLAKAMKNLQRQQRHLGIA